MYYNRCCQKKQEGIPTFSVGKFTGIGCRILWNNGVEVMIMAKQGMKRFERQYIQGENKLPIVPQIQGKAKFGKVKAKPIVAGTAGAELKVWHEKPIPKAYRAIDTDLARDNIENDLTFADLQDL